MDEFLVWSKNIQDDFSSTSKVLIVLGNEACDLDSAVSAITYAYYLRNKYKDSTVIPVLNIPESQYRLRTETNQFFKKLNIQSQSLTFRDQIDFGSLQSDRKLKLYLVDHNALTGSDIIFEDCVVAVIDHHVRERPEKEGVAVKLDFVGSCCTLVAEELLADPDFHIDEKLAELLFGTILVDTINRSPAAGKITPRDQDVLDKLQAIIPNIKGDNLYKELQAAKFDMSGLLNMEILEKDLKMVPGSGMTIAMASVTMDMEELLKRPNFQTDLAEFSATRGADVVVIMTLTTDKDETPSRQIAVYSLNRIYKEQIADVLDNAADENLELEPCFPPFETISVFKQGNAKASRKKVMPILKSFLQGDVTPDVTCKEFVPQQSVSITNEGFTSFTSLLESGPNNGDENSSADKPNETKNVVFNLDSIEGLENSFNISTENLTENAQNNTIKPNFATVNTQITNAGVNFDMFATQNDDSEFESVTPSDAGQVSKPDNPFSQFSSTNLSSVNSSNMLDFLTSDSELVDPFSSVEENVNPAQTFNTDKIHSVSSDPGFNQNQPLLDISVQDSSVPGSSLSNTKFFDTNRLFDVSAVSTDNAQPTNSQNMDILVDFTNTTEVNATSNTNNSHIVDAVMSSSNPFSDNSDGSQIVYQNNPFMLSDNTEQQNLEKTTNLIDTEVSNVSNTNDTNSALNQLTGNNFLPLDGSDTFELIKVEESQNDYGANSEDPFGIFDKPNSSESKTGNDTFDLFGKETPVTSNPFEVDIDNSLELNKNNPFNLPLETTYAAESQFEDMPENENPFQMDYLDIENEGKTSRPKARKSISLIVEIDQLSEEKLDELNEADFFDKVPTPDVQHSGENSPFINSGVSSPIEGIPTPNTTRVSGFPSISTPPNSVMEESGFDARDHDLPSFNSAEMVERINKKKASLGNIGENVEKMGEEEEGKASVTFTPQNSFHDDPPIPSVNLILPDLDSPEIENTIQVKRNSLITTQEFTSAEEDLLGLTKSSDEQGNLEDKNNDQTGISAEAEVENDIALAKGKENLDSITEDLAYKKVPDTPVNSYVESSGASFMQNRDTFTDSELFDRLSDIKRDRSDTGQNSVVEGLDKLEPFVDDTTVLSKGDEINVVSNEISAFNENGVNGTFEQLDNISAVQDGFSVKKKEFGIETENTGNSTTGNQDLLGSLSKDNELESANVEKIDNDIDFFDSLLGEKQKSIEPINTEHDVGKIDNDIDFFDSLQGEKQKSIESINTENKIHTNDTCVKDSKFDEPFNTGNTSNNEMLQNMDTELVQDMSEAITTELISHAVNVFPDMTNPDVAECVTMEILMDGCSDWTDQGSGDSGIGSSDSPQQAVARAPPRSPRSPRRAPASQYSLETDYMPNMDPFQGNLNIVTSPSTVVQSVETDAGKEVVEEESFRRVSVEVGHGIPSEPFTVDELQDVAEVPESSIRDMIISENLEMSQGYDNQPVETFEQSMDFFSKSNFVEEKKDTFMATSDGDLKLPDDLTESIAIENEATEGETESNVIIGNNEDIDKVNVHGMNLMKESESMEEEMENICETETESDLIIGNIEDIDKVHVQDISLMKESESMEEEKETVDTCMATSDGDLKLLDLTESIAIENEATKHETEDKVKVNVQDISLMKESESMEEEMENVVQTETPLEGKLDFENSELINNGDTLKENVLGFIDSKEPDLGTTVPNINAMDQPDKAYFDGNNQETNTQSNGQAIPPSELLLEGVVDTTVQNPVEINIEECSISPDSSNSFNSSTDSEVDLITVRENIIDSSPTDQVEQLDETVSEVNSGQVTQETANYSTETVNNSEVGNEQLRNEDVVPNETEQIIDSNLLVDENNLFENSEMSENLVESTLTIETVSPLETPDHEHASGFYKVNPDVKGESLERSVVETNLGDNETGFYEFGASALSMTESSLTVDSVSPAETPNDEYVTGFYEINPQNEAIDNTPEISVSMTTSTETENSDVDGNTGFYEMNSEIKGTVLQNIKIGDAFSPAESPNDDIVGISYQINPMIPDLRTQSSVDTDENDKSDLSVFESASTTETKTSLDEDTNTNDETLLNMADGLVNDAIKGAFETVHEIQTQDDSEIVRQIEDAMIEEDKGTDVEGEEEDKSSESSEDSDVSSTTTEGSYRINCSPVMTPESESMLEEHVKKMRTNEVYVIEESANEELEEDEGEAVEEMIINNETDKTSYSEMKTDSEESSVTHKQEPAEEEEGEGVEEIIINNETDKALYSEMKTNSEDSSVTDKQEPAKGSLEDLSYTNNKMDIDKIDSKTTDEIGEKDVTLVGSVDVEDKSGSSSVTLLRQETIIPDIVISAEDGNANNEAENEKTIHIDSESDDQVLSDDNVDMKQNVENKAVYDSSSAGNTVSSDTQSDDKLEDIRKQKEITKGSDEVNIVENKSNNETGAINKSKKEESSVSITKSKLSEQEYTTRKEIFYTTAGRMSVSIDSVVDPPGLADHVSHGGSQNPISEETMPGDDDFDPLDLKDASQITETTDSQQQQQPDSAQQQQQKSSQDKGVIKKSHKKKNDGKMKEMDDTQEWHEDPIPGMGVQEDDLGSSESESESDSDSEYGKPVRPDSLLAGKKKKKILANSSIVTNDSTDDLVEGVDDLPTPDDLETPDDMEGELEWEDDTPITPSSEKKFADYIHTRDDDDDDDNEFEQNTRMRKVEIAGKDYKVDMHVIEPYKKVLSHGGYYGDGLNAIILFCGCYLPDRSRRDYQYVMDNLFLYVISTLELLVAEDYMIVYFHGATPRRQMPSFGWLKRCYQMIDRRLRKNLKALLMVHPTLWLKTVVMMTKPFISSKFSSKLRFVKTLQELGKIVPMEYIYIPDPVQHTEVMVQSDPNYLEKLDKEYQKKGLQFKKKKR